jgi:hypothetical protein
MDSPGASSIRRRESPRGSGLLLQVSCRLYHITSFILTIRHGLVADSLEQLANAFVWMNTYHFEMVSSLNHGRRGDSGVAWVCLWDTHDSRLTDIIRDLRTVVRPTSNNSSRSLSFVLDREHKLLNGHSLSTTCPLFSKYVVIIATIVLCIYNRVVRKF